MKNLTMNQTKFDLLTSIVTGCLIVILGAAYLYGCAEDDSKHAEDGNYVYAKH